MSANRITQLTEAMNREGLATVAIVPGANLRYLTGVDFHVTSRLSLVLFPADGGLPCFVVPTLEMARVQSSIAIPVQFYPWNDANGPAEALRSAVDKLVPDTAARVGIEYTVMRVRELRALEEAAPGLQTVDATPLLAGLRMVKEQDELAAMAEAVRIIEVAFQQTIAQIRPGVTERELATTLANAIIAAGGDGESFPSIVAGGPNGAYPHHENSDRPLEVGDLIIIDGGARYGAYLSDMTRTVALGEPGPEARRIHDLVLRANAAGRAALRPGITGEQIDQAARAVITAGGYGEYFIHRTGHGLGLDEHEPPYIVAGSTDPLPVGATFTIEPGIYIEGIGGVRIEDDVVITAEGGRSLTSFERELLVLPV